MKKFIVVFISLFLFACGGSNGGGSSAPQHAPAISNLHLYPSSATVGQGYGAVTINLSFDFSDQDSNITTCMIDWSDTTGASGTISGDCGVSGYSSGTAYGYVMGDTSVASTTYFAFYVIDSTGLQSNKLTGTWTVYP